MSMRACLWQTLALIVPYRFCVVQVFYNGTISRRAREVTVHVPAGSSLTSYVDITPDFRSLPALNSVAHVQAAVQFG